MPLLFMSLKYSVAFPADSSALSKILTIILFIVGFGTTPLSSMST